MGSLLDLEGLEMFKIRVQQRSYYACSVILLLQ